MRNYSLQNMIHSKGSSLTELADCLGICYNSLLNKLDGRTDWKLSEIKAIVSKYSLTACEVVEIFFK